MIVILASLILAAMTADVPATVSAVSREPFYAGIVTKAEALKSETEAFGRAPDTSVRNGAPFQRYAADITALSEADMKGHLDLKARGTDRDLKCILMGVSLDLPTKLKAIETAQSHEELTAAFDDMAALLSDNVDVIVTPAKDVSGLDCTLEFGNR